MFNLAILIVCSVLVWRRFSRCYEDGLPLVVGLLAVLPDSVCIEAVPIITLSRLLIVISLIFWLQNPSLRRGLSQAPLYKIQLVLVVCFFISTLPSEFFEVSVKRFFCYLLESFLLFLIVQSSVTDCKQATRLVTAIGYGLLFVALLGFGEHFFGFELFNSNSGGYEGAAERFTWVPENALDYIHATYIHRILFGVACALGAAKFLVDGGLFSGKWPTIRNFGMFFVCGSSLFFSNSRGPWIAFIICSFLLLMLFPKRFLKKVLVFGLLVLVVIIMRPGIWSTISGLADQTVDTDSYRGGSFKWRMIVWNVAVNEIGKSDPFHFLFGYGGGSHIMTDFGTAEVHPGLFLPLASWDCEFAIILYERGVVGFVCVALLYILGITQVARYLYRHRLNLDAAMTWTLTCLVIMLLMTANVALFAPQLTFISAFALGIASKYLATSGFECENPEPVTTVHAT